jgi:hypothetical protein
MKYKVWVKDHKDETLKEIEVPPYKDGSAPTMLKIRGTACRSSHFDWADYQNLKHERITTKEDP